MGVLTDIREAGYAVLTLDWPEQKNAIGPEEARQVATAVAEAGARPNIKAVVLTGNGAFSAGGNIKGMVARADMPPEERRKLVYSAYQGMIRAVVDCPVPTIAAIDGPALGLGLDLALACDRRLIGPDGWVRQGWARIGAVAGTGGVLFLELKAPGALWQILPGQPKVDGPTAERLGIGQAEIETTALEAAERVAADLTELPAATLRGYVELSRADLRARLEDHLAEALRLQIGLLADPGFRDRAQAALAKPPSS